MIGLRGQPQIGRNRSIHQDCRELLSEAGGIALISLTQNNQNWVVLQYRGCRQTWI